MNFLAAAPLCLATFAPVLLATFGCSAPIPDQPAEPAVGLRFEEVTARAGIDRSGESWGIAWGDFDGDGRPDLWAGNHRQAPSLWHNNGDGTFTDIASAVIVGKPRRDTHGVAWADFDNDGDLDLFESSGGGGLPAFDSTRPEHQFANNLYRSTGGNLVEEALSWKVGDRENRGRGGLWIDWNLDGRLDLALAAVAHGDGSGGSRALVQEADAFADLTDELGFTCGSSTVVVTADLDGDGVLDFLCSSASEQSLFSLRGGELRDLTARLPQTKSLGDTLVADFDGDLRTDLLVLRYSCGADVALIGPRVLRMSWPFGRKNERRLRFKADGDLRFRFKSPRPFHLAADQIFVGAEGTHPTLPEPPDKLTEMTLTPHDPAFHGLMQDRPEKGLFVGYSRETSTWSILLSGGVKVVGEVLAEERIQDLRSAGSSRCEPAPAPVLLINAEEALLDRSSASGLDHTVPCYSGVAADFDNDMDIDLYFVCSTPARNLANLLYDGLGDGTFRLVEGAGGAIGSMEGSGTSVAAADFDGDGFLDLVVTNGRGELPVAKGPDQLFRNLGNDNHWLEIDLVGTVSNRDGIGARLLVTAGGVTQVREQGGGVHRLAQDHSRIHFGLGPHRIVERLTIRWPTGEVQELTEIDADQILRVVEPDFF